PGVPAGGRLGRACPFPRRSPRIHRAAQRRRGQGDRADARLHRPAAHAVKLLAIIITPLLLLAPAVAAGTPEGRSEAPVGQITWAVHTTLVPTYFDPAETTIITSFMVLYALHDGLVKPMPGKPLAASLGRIVVRITRWARLRLRPAPGREIPQR